MYNKITNEAIIYPITAIANMILDLKYVMFVY